MVSHLRKPTIPLTKKQIKMGPPRFINKTEFKNLLRKELKKKYDGPVGFDIVSIADIYRKLKKKHRHINLTSEEISKFINILIENWVIDLKLDIVTREVYFCFNE
ncbi:MAG: hypothetical protein HYW77_02640 [Parcubacteria group bacterium]|nr:hypothetical protein [Parcubacteria group bacterium]